MIKKDHSCRKLRITRLDLDILDILEILKVDGTFSFKEMSLILKIE